MANDWEAKMDWALQRIRERSSVSAGCDEAVLEEYQRRRALNLPAAYVRFLRAVGMNAGEFLAGSDFLFTQLDELQSGAHDLLEDDGGPPIAKNAFVFCGHQGYQFLFFHLGEGLDPEIHYYMEGEGSFKVVSPAFSEWLVNTVHDEFPDVARWNSKGG